jgi:hypothetical protein
VKREPAFHDSARPGASAGSLDVRLRRRREEKRRDSIGVAGAARMLWLRGRGLRALQMQRVSATREYDRRSLRWGAMHGPGADVAVTSDEDQTQRETTCRARHDAPVLMSWHSSELTRIMCLRHGGHGIASWTTCSAVLRSRPAQTGHQWHRLRLDGTGVEEELSD